MNIKSDHGKIYADFFGYGEQDIILCENCPNIASDIHHIIFRSKGGRNVIENLIAICRECHKRAHFIIQPYLTAEELQGVHNVFIRVRQLQIGHNR